jgi:predicted GIY-YIG superfamily endonuclease
MIGIYKITNPKNKIYIGQSKNIEERWRGYKRLKEKNGQRKLYFSFQKYGYENHKFEVLEEYLLEQLHEREIYWKNKILKEKNNNWNQVLFLQVDDRGDFTNKWKINRLKSIRKTLLQYDMDGNFIKEWISAAEAIKSFEKGNANNINDAARGNIILHIIINGDTNKEKDINII